jgi:hypothetical protein
MSEALLTTCSANACVAASPSLSWPEESAEVGQQRAWLEGTERTGRGFDGELLPLVISPSTSDELGVALAGAGRVAGDVDLKREGDMDVSALSRRSEHHSLTSSIIVMPRDAAYSRMKVMSERE